MRRAAEVDPEVEVKEVAGVVKIAVSKLIDGLSSEVGKLSTSSDRTKLVVSGIAASLLLSIVLLLFLLLVVGYGYCSAT